LIDMGPGGGHKGGTVIAAGTPEELAEVPESYTGQFLRPVLGLGPNPSLDGPAGKNGTAQAGRAAQAGKAAQASKAAQAGKKAAPAKRAPAKRTPAKAAARTR
jgi:excinuclease ABC subunit A